MQVVPQGGGQEGTEVTWGTQWRALGRGELWMVQEGVCAGAGGPEGGSEEEPSLFASRRAAGRRPTEAGDQRPSPRRAGAGRSWALPSPMCCRLGSNPLAKDGDRSGQGGDIEVLEGKRWACRKWQARGHWDIPRGSHGLNYRAPRNDGPQRTPVGPAPQYVASHHCCPGGLRVHTSGQLLSGSTPSASPLLAPRTAWGRQSP